MKASPLAQSRTTAQAQDGLRGLSNRQRQQTDKDNTAPSAAQDVPIFSTGQGDYMPKLCTVRRHYAHHDALGLTVPGGDTPDNAERCSLGACRTPCTGLGSQFVSHEFIWTLMDAGARISKNNPGAVWTLCRWSASGFPEVRMNVAGESVLPHSCLLVWAP